MNHQGSVQSGDDDERPKIAATHMRVGEAVGENEGEDEVGEREGGGVGLLVVGRGVGLRLDGAPVGEAVGRIAHTALTVPD